MPTIANPPSAGDYAGFFNAMSTVSESTEAFLQCLPSVRAGQAPGPESMAASTQLPAPATSTPTTAALERLFRPPPAVDLVAEWEAAKEEEDDGLSTESGDWVTLNQQGEEVDEDGVAVVPLSRAAAASSCGGLGASRPAGAQFDNFCGPPEDGTAGPACTSAGPAAPAGYVPSLLQQQRAGARAPGPGAARPRPRGPPPMRPRDQSGRSSGGDGGDGGASRGVEGSGPQGQAVRTLEDEARLLFQQLRAAGAASSTAQGAGAGPVGAGPTAAPAPPQQPAAAAQAVARGPGAGDVASVPEPEGGSSSSGGGATLGALSSLPGACEPEAARMEHAAAVASLLAGAGSGAEMLRDLGLAQHSSEPPAPCAEAEQAEQGEQGEQGGDGAACAPSAPCNGHGAACSGQEEGGEGGPTFAAVEAFSLDANFDYDNVVLTPREWPYSRLPARAAPAAAAPAAAH